MTTPPNPTFTVTISVGACEWDVLVRRLTEEVQHVAAHGPECKAVWGGAGTHGHVQIERRDVTGEQYNEELLAWWNAQREGAA